MDFTLDEHQQVIAQVAARVLEYAPPDAAWKALAGAGLLALALPAWLGGDSLGVLETSVLLTEVGRRAAPVPALATLSLGVLPLVRWGSREQQEALLPGVAAGGQLLTAAIREPSDPMPAAPRTTATAQLRVTGRKIGVEYAMTAHRILVPVSLSTGGTAVVLVDPSADGVSLHPTPGSAGTSEYTVEFDGAAAELLGGDGAVDDLYRLAVAGACAVGAGALAGALALTTRHIGAREQFGRPLAAFQAVAQQIADVYIVSRTLHLATMSACWRLGEGQAGNGDLEVAAYWLADQAPAALRTCHHLHGGLGLDVTYPLHQHSSLIRDLVRFVGGAEHRLDRLGDGDVH